jgi:hypothetical protein
MMVGPPSGSLSGIVNRWDPNKTQQKVKRMLYLLNNPLISKGDLENE